MNKELFQQFRDEKQTFIKVEGYKENNFNNLWMKYELFNSLGMKNEFLVKFRN